jgi:hypothetical protein
MRSATDSGLHIHAQNGVCAPRLAYEERNGNAPNVGDPERRTYRVCVLQGLTARLALRGLASELLVIHEPTLPITVEVLCYTADGALLL